MMPGLGIKPRTNWWKASAVTTAPTLLPYVQNIRDFPQTKLYSEINSPFLLNEHNDPPFFFPVFAKNSLIKNIFKEEKKFDSGRQ